MEISSNEIVPVLVIESNTGNATAVTQNNLGEDIGSVPSATEEIRKNVECSSSNIENNLKPGDEHDGDEFAYTKAERFTSEIFKIEVGNLPKFFGFGK